MKLELTRIENGVLLKVNDGIAYLCYQEMYDNEHDAFAALLRVICDNYGPSDSRYSEKRIHIITKHGDKYECPNAPCEYCEELEPFTAEPVSSDNP